MSRSKALLVTRGPLCPVMMWPEINRALDRQTYTRLTALLLLGFLPLPPTPVAIVTHLKTCYNLTSPIYIPGPRPYIAFLSKAKGRIMSFLVVTRSKPTEETDVTIP